jgi:hypothetical protein
MGTNVPEKLRAIAREIAERGYADQTRLVVMKKWFERPQRLTAFAVWIARRAISGKVPGSAAGLFAQARALLKGVNSYGPQLNRAAAQTLHDRLRESQNEFEQQRWGPVRIIRNWNLLLVEEALAICLWHADSPSHGYKLAADFCQHYDSRYGSGLSGPSRARISAIARFLAGHEAMEDQQ